MRVSALRACAAASPTFVRRRGALEAGAAALQRRAVADGRGRRQRERHGAPPLHPLVAAGTHPPPRLLQASIEALDKRMRECGWAQKFCSAMASLQVAARSLCPRALPADNNARVQAANEAHDSSAATAASRDAHQLLHAVQSEEGFTMQVPLHSRAQRWRV
jgi:hypothetical protein